MSHARFIQGSTMRHVTIMSLSGATGLTALFLVDMLDLFFLSLLGEKFLAAAIGYAGTILFLTTSIGIGLSIATAALVSKALGEQDKLKAKRYMVNIIVISFFISSLIALFTWLNISGLLSLIGAKGEVHHLARQYLLILVPSMPVLALAMCFGAGLRAVGDAKLSMNSTLAGGAVNAALDPVFIFLLDMGIEGAATASVFARFTILAVSIYGLVYKHDLFCRFNLDRFKQDLTNIFKIAIPAMATNLAMPVSSAFITRSIADYGDRFVAGYAIIGRIIPVSFGVVFALSGAIGPIIGQNYGARLLDRVRQSLRDAYLFATVYILAISFVIFLLQDILVTTFSATGNAALIVRFFCTFIAVSFLFNAFLFIANASFNNLGKATYSTLLNWGRATLGTIPFVIVGAQIDGVYGILAGQAIGGVLFAFLAVMLSFKNIRRIEEKSDSIEKVILVRETFDPEEVALPCALNPHSSECAQMCQIAEEAECEEHLLEEVPD